MSRKGNCYDKAKAESFFKTIKAEDIYLNEYESYEEAKANVARFIEDYTGPNNLDSVLRLNYN